MAESFWTPDDLINLSNGYWTVCALHAGVKLDLFTPLSACQYTAVDLAGLVGADSRGVEMLLNALTALGFVEKHDTHYSATMVSAEFLSRTSPNYLGFILMHHHYLMASWAHLDEAVRSGAPIRNRYAHGDDAAVREGFEMGMFNLASQIAPSLAERLDLEGRRRLLDLGGGPGTYAVHFCRRYSGLTAVVFDRPTTRPFADEVIDRYGLTDRIAFVAGDYLEGQIPGRYDVAWISHVLHAQGPDECAAILGKVAASLEPGGLVFLQDFMMNDRMDGPPFPALFSLNMLLGTGKGRAYSEGQLVDMLSAAGFCSLRRLPLVLPSGAGIIAGEMP